MSHFKWREPKHDLLIGALMWSRYIFLACAVLVLVCGDFAACGAMCSLALLLWAGELHVAWSYPVKPRFSSRDYEKHWVGRDV